MCTTQRAQPRKPDQKGALEAIPLWSYLPLRTYLTVGREWAIHFRDHRDPPERAAERRPRCETRQAQMNVRQRRKLFAGAGVISMLFGALMVVAPVTAGAEGSDPSGFNGTVKVDGLDLDDGPGHTNKPNDPRADKTDNDPHVACGLQLEFFNFDEGETAEITITAHPPSGRAVGILARLEQGGTGHPAGR